MISTRAHAVLDYGVAALLGGVAAAATLPPQQRRLLGAAACCYAGYAALSDHQGGLLPSLSMRQHRLLGTAGALALGGAGVLMRRASPAVRALLIGTAAMELGVVAFSRPELPSQTAIAPDMCRTGKAGQSASVGYPPLDTPKPVADGIFVVDSLLPGRLGSFLPARMTVVRLSNGDLLLHSPTRFSPSLQQALEAIGPIRHLVAPNVAHWMFLQDWQHACPQATTWAAPGLRRRRQVRRSGVRLDRDLPESTPVEWNGEIRLVTVPGGFGFQEVALFHQPTTTLVLTDLVLNLEPAKLPAALRPLVRLFGSAAPDGMPPPYLRAIIKLRRNQARDAAQTLLALKPKRVIFAHGQWFAQDGTARLRRSLRWLVA